jgi:hypothetical protein
MSTAISKLRRVPLRDVWKHEAYNFTQWLQENIDVLNGTLDLDLISAEKEQAAGAFSIDIVAESSDGESYVIENQLEKSNHDHLGKLITYYASMKARGAIWIVAEPRPEHVNAMSWLNEASGADFYLVKVEAICIDESPAAPLLTLIVGPSAEAKNTGQVKKEMAERHHLRHEWWTMLVERDDAKLHAHINPGNHSYLGTSSGSPGLSYNYSVRQNECGAELYIDRGSDSEAANLAIFEQLIQSRSQIEQDVNEQLIWEPMEGRRACRIQFKIPGGYRMPKEEWPKTQERIVSVMTKFELAFRPVLATLKLGV